MTEPTRIEPTKQLQDMVARMRKPFEGVATFASQEPQIITREKGVYAYLFVRPTRRFASALSVDRELLVLFTSFNEQQQRTVKIAKELINESTGRLESTVAIIVHKDPEGNLKLTKWGRSLGIAVLPVFFGRLPSNSEELSKQLCYELFSHDPFDVTGPVSDDENFFGRRNEALDLARKLQGGQIRACLGIRKIGKTSVINRVINECRLHYDCLCIFVDCSKDELWSLSAEQLLTSMAEAILKASEATALDGYSVVSEPASKRTLTDATKTLLDAILGATKPVIVFIDEVDYITPGSPTSEYWRDGFNKFWRNFRSVYQEAARSGRTISVMIGGVSAKWFVVDTIGKIENAALALVPEEYLSPLDRNATIAMIRKISKTAGLSFSNDSADAIAAACSDMPFWVRKACSYIHRNTEISKRPTTVDLPTTSTLVEKFITNEGTTLAHVAISHLFRVYPELRDPCIKTLAGNVTGISPVHLSTLRKYGIISPTGAVKASGSMFLEALKTYQATIDSEEQQGPGAAEQMSKEGSSLAEWAEELAVVSKTRNMLEKRMRQIALNFLRADAIAKKQPKGSAKNRILAVMAEERKHRLKELASDELIEKLFWKELAALIVKEWQVFADVFADRKRFQESCDIINDRPDTHAKDADVADIALQRRELDWLTDRLNAM